ncbi:MAG: N-acetyltransferase [bacterium]
MAFNDEQAAIPEGIRTADFLIRPLLAADARLDYAAVMESRDFLRSWDQSGWPEDGFSLADNRADLERAEQRHNAREAFTFTVMNPEQNECLGCIYIFPRNARWLAEAAVQPGAEMRWEEIDAVAMFWIRQSRLAEQLDRRLLMVLRDWFAREWQFGTYCLLTNEQLLQQAQMFEDMALRCRLSLRLPEHPGCYRAYTW